MLDENFDYSVVQPAMRQTVRWLRKMDMNTTDSGDGVTNVLAEMEHALDFPHVFITTSPLLGLAEADIIWGAVRRYGLDKVEGVSVEATYSPDDRKVIISVYGVTDELLATHGVPVGP